MNFRLTTGEGEDLVFHPQLPPELLKHQVFPTVMSASGHWGTIIFQVMITPDFSIWYCNFLIEKDSSFHIETDAETIEFYIVLKNDFDFDVKGFEKISVRENQFNMTYLPVIKMEGTSGPSGASGPSGPSGASDSSGPSGPSGTSGSSGASRPSGPSEAEIQESIRKHMESLLLPVGKTLLPEDLFNDLKKKIGNVETIHNLSVEQAIRLSSLRRMAREHTAAVEWLVRQPTDVQTEYMRVKQRR